LSLMGILHPPRTWNAEIQRIICSCCCSRDVPAEKQLQAFHPTLKVMPAQSHPSTVSMCVLVLAAVVNISCGGSSSPGSTASSQDGSIPLVSHVFLLVEENHSYNSVIGNPTMPYTNSLAQKYALATHYYADAHPSLPNYFMLTT